MERQALRDAVARYNAEGLNGLHDRPRSGRKPRLTEAERTTLSQLITDGPDVEASGLSAWTLADLCAEIKLRWAKTLHPASLSRVVRKLGFSRQKARQVHPQSRKDVAVQSADDRRHHRRNLCRSERRLLCPAIRFLIGRGRPTLAVMRVARSPTPARSPSRCPFLSVVGQINVLSPGFVAA